MARVNPPRQLKLPQSVASNPDLKKAFDDLNFIVFQLWQRTGAGDDFIRNSQIDELYSSLQPIDHDNINRELKAFYQKNNTEKNNINLSTNIQEENVNLTINKNTNNTEEEKNLNGLLNIIQSKIDNLSLHIQKETGQNQTNNTSINKTKNANASNIQNANALNNTKSINVKTEKTEKNNFNTTIKNKHKEITNYKNEHKNEHKEITNYKNEQKKDTNINFNFQNKKDTNINFNFQNKKDEDLIVVTQSDFTTTEAMTVVSDGTSDIIITLNPNPDDGEKVIIKRAGLGVITLASAKTVNTLKNYTITTIYDNITLLFLGVKNEWIFFK